MNDIEIKNPFKHPFLSLFVLTPDTLPFTSEEIVQLDKELNKYEQIFLNPDIERSLISKNELLASFAISKAENSSLTLTEAQEVYDLVLANPEYNFINQKIKEKKKLTQKDYDKLEFFNIAKTFRLLNQQAFTIHDLTPNIIKTIHRQITQGLDIFKDYLNDFTIYKSGHWRDNDTIRVGEYIPAPHEQIESGVKELISWLKDNQTITGVAIFHTALYGLHAFNNGNKRVCRILEHILLRQIGINSKNLYSTSYYYHKEKARYYKYLLFSLERKNLNHFVSFVLESSVISIISVVKTSLEAKRSEFIARQDITIKSILKPLIKREEIQFKNLLKPVKNKMARQTFVDYLQKAVDEKVILRREAGRATYYTLNLKTPEEETIRTWINFAKSRLSYISDEILLVQKLKE